MSKLNWIYTKDHRPTFEECEGKVVVYHWPSQSENSIDSAITEREAHWKHIFDDGIIPDKYCIITITDPDPEPVPCKVCGGKVEYVHDPAYDGDKNPYVVECTRGGHVISFTAPTRAEAIQLWNKWNGG